MARSRSSATGCGRSTPCSTTRSIASTCSISPAFAEATPRTCDNPAMKISLLFALAILLPPLGYAQPVKVTVVAVESVDDFKRWLGKPVDPARAAAAASYPGRLSDLPFGRKTQLPILVTGL